MDEKVEDTPQIVVNQSVKTGGASGVFWGLVLFFIVLPICSLGGCIFCVAGTSATANLDRISRDIEREAAIEQAEEEAAERARIRQNKRSEAAAAEREAKAQVYYDHKDFYAAAPELLKQAKWNVRNWKTAEYRTRRIAQDELDALCSKIRQTERALHIKRTIITGRSK